MGEGIGRNRLLKQLMLGYSFDLWLEGRIQRPGFHLLIRKFSLLV